MTLQNQWNTIKKNWLISVLILVIFVLPFFSSNVSMGFDGAIAESMTSREMVASSYYPQADFAPEVEERKITKSASLSTEIERGEFKEADTRLRAIVIATDSFLLDENMYTSEDETRSGSYQIKVEADVYDTVVSQLKQIGELQSFSENARDITGRHTSATEELAAEKARLTRFQSMFNQATKVSDRIQLTDRMYDIERRIGYLEDSLQNVDSQVSYSTLHVTLQEESSGYANIVFVKFSDLVRSLVNSIGDVLTLLFWAIPWAVGILIIWFVVRLVKKN